MDKIRNYDLKHIYINSRYFLDTHNMSKMRPDQFHTHIHAHAFSHTHTHTITHMHTRMQTSTQIHIGAAERWAIFTLMPNQSQFSVAGHNGTHSQGKEGMAPDQEHTAGHLYTQRDAHTHTDACTYTSTNLLRGSLQHTMAVIKEATINLKQKNIFNWRCTLAELIAGASGSESTSKLIKTLAAFFKYWQVTLSF